MTAQAGPGACYEFAPSGDLTRTFDDPSHLDGFNEQFGTSMTVSGGNLIVGSPQQTALVQFTDTDDAGNPILVESPFPVGEAFAFDLSQAQPNAVAIDNPNKPATSDDIHGSPDNFGAAVISSGASVYIANPNSDQAAVDAGAIYKFSPHVNAPPPPPVTVAPPTANAGNDQTVLEGSTVQFSGSGSADTGHTISAYAWDFNYAGTPASFHADANGQTASSTFSNGSHIVALRVTDDTGQTAVSTVHVTVNNVPPQVSPISGPTQAVAQQALSFNGSFTDPGLNDTYQVQWNFGDGSTIAFHPSTDAGALHVSHTFITTGSFPVTLSVRDGDGAVTTVSSVVNVSNANVQNGNLFVGGTTGDDDLALTAGKNGAVKVSINGAAAVSYSPTGHIVLLGGEGNDTLHVGAGVTLNAELYGGAGDDNLHGGGGSDILDGDDGNDTIVGGTGRDVVIGGRGADRLSGGLGDDIIVGGDSPYEGNSPALEAALAEWTSTRDFTTRVKNLRDGSGSTTH